ncbi:metal ABC transporter substrate-binding protein [Metabacillus iocasae]|uniref:Zinc transport system substrate-binding protein n=1 Tax=Priestia iocasae TaxID=2291674 RepID=A0ABS2R260_9BACI|nr:metal ABC transporter substrate-binding protein [Metabacillus iocasae]MBM7704824.1 zinc transport system substrate-binding protein [Metabacillus iocasae]
MKLKATLMALLLGASTALAGCGSDVKEEASSTSSSDDKLNIYTTIYPLQDFATKIGGEHVNVESIFPPGVDAHTFEPTSKTMVNLAQADAFIYSGIGLEGFVDNAKKTLVNEEVQLVEAAEDIELAQHAENHDAHAHEEENHNDHAHEEESHDAHAHGDEDPHVWIDPILSITLAENIKKSLVELKPDAKEDFEKNFEAVKADLLALDQEFKQTIETSSKKEILVAHAAYGYWEKRYGLQQISVAGLSPTNEPSQKQLKEIIKEAQEHQIKYIIFEQNLQPKIAELVQKEIDAEALTLHNLESATKEDVQNNEDYFSIMKKNIETLKKALN